MIHQIQSILILLLLFVIGFGALAQRLKIPYPIVMVIGGLLVTFIPGLPRVYLEPDLVFFAVLPPLLFCAAYETSWREFRENLPSILSLAFGLVGFTVLGVALAAHWLIPGFDWRLGLVLGAAIAPTDAIAATAIAKRVGLPQRIVDILEGESLVNDATGLLALEFSTAFVVSGQVPTFSEGGLRLITLIVGGAAIGWLVAASARFVGSRIDGIPLEISLSIVTPYVAYLGAEALHASGVLAAVVAGLYLGRQSSQEFSPGVRVEMHSFWNTNAFLLNGIVFVLIGLQVPYVMEGIRGITWRELITSAAQLSAAVIVLRLVWVYPGAYVGQWIRRSLFHQKEEEPVSRAGVFVIGWTGMRGVVSLAAALALPATLANGQPFPQRGAVLFLTFSVILVTLVLQGLTLPSVIRGLHLPISGKQAEEEQAARHAMLEAALLHLDQLRAEDQGEFRAVYDATAERYALRLASLQPENGEGASNGSAELEKQYRVVAAQLREVERRTAIGLRNKQKIGDQVLRRLERELDLLNLRFGD